MISQRFLLDERSIFDLSPIQLKARNAVRQKVLDGEYVFEKVCCPICMKLDFDRLAEKDRYGLRMYTCICRNCGLIQTNPRMTQESYDRFYKEDQKLLYVGEPRPTEEYFEKQYRRGLDIYQRTCRQGMRNIVEVGCAAGGVLKPFRDNGCEVFGLDLNEEYVEYGVKEHGLNLHVGTLGDTPLPWTPDLIIYSHTLEHILRPVYELKSARLQSHYDTMLYIELPGVKNLTNSYNRDFLEYLQNAHVYHFTLKTLMNMVTKAGWIFLVGDEYIRSTFVAGEPSDRIENDMPDAMSFLLSLEKK